MLAIISKLVFIKDQIIFLAGFTSQEVLNSNLGVWLDIARPPSMGKIEIKAITVLFTYHSVLV
jgi:hypothetical protein